MVKDRIYFVAVFFLLVFTLFLAGVSATQGVGLAYPTLNASNISGVNSSGPGEYLNASILAVDNQANIGVVSFYYQPQSYALNGTWTFIANVTNSTANQSTFNTTWDTTAVDDGTYFLNVTSWVASNDSVNATNATIYITTDNTAPTFEIYTGASLTAFANGTIKTNTTAFAQNLTLNISVTDATYQSNYTNTFCVVNIAGGLNHTVPYLSNQWCNLSNVNISTLSDGNQTINIYVNDSLNNMRLNSTWVVQVDTTVPTANASCTETTVQSGDGFPCTCATSDATSGINSASSGGTSSSPDGTSTPSSTGTFTYTCGAVDNGGLAATSSSIVYTVNQIPGTGSSSGGGGGSSSSGTTTDSSSTVGWSSFYYSATESDLKSGYEKEFAEKVRVKFDLSSGSHHVGVVSLTATEATVEIASNPIQVVLSVGEDAKVDVDNDGFYDLHVTLNGIADSKADLNIEKINEEIPSDSTSGSVDTSGEVVGQDQGASSASQDSGNNTWLWIVIIAVVVAIVFAVSRGRKQ